VQDDDARSQLSLSKLKAHELMKWDNNPGVL